MARCALILLALGCIFAAVAAQAPAVAPDLIITNAVNAAVAAAEAAETAAAAAVAAALNLQRTIEQQQQQPQPQPLPQPVAVAVGAPAPVPPQTPESGVPSPSSSTFAVPGFEQPLAGTAETDALPLAGLATPSAEVEAVLVEEGGVPAPAIPAGLPERLSASLQGNRPLVGGR